MSKQISFEYQGKEYCLEYTRASIRFMEQNMGFNPNDIQDKFMTRGECKRLMCAHDTAIAEIRSDIKTGNINILHKLEAMDRKSEERAVAAHNRIEPLVHEIAKNIGQVELIKETFIRSVVGDKK